jgi:hypothetical protein
VVARIHDVKDAIERNKKENWLFKRCLQRSPGQVPRRKIEAKATSGRYVGSTVPFRERGSFDSITGPICGGRSFSESGQNPAHAPQQKQRHYSITSSARPSSVVGNVRLLPRSSVGASWSIPTCSIRGSNDFLAGTSVSQRFHNLVELSVGRRPNMRSMLPLSSVGAVSRQTSLRLETIPGIGAG